MQKIYLENSNKKAADNKTQSRESPNYSLIFNEVASVRFTIILLSNLNKSVYVAYLYFLRPFSVLSEIKKNLQ